MSVPLSALVPSLEYFASWKGLDSTEGLDAPTENVQMFLQLSTDLLVLASGITEGPEPSTPVGRIVRAAICDMAWYIGTSLESRDEQFSPFSAERIGSYSYTKASKSISDGGSTGVPFFDLALKYLAGLTVSDAGGAISMSTEHVFAQPFAPTPRTQGVWY